MSVTEPGRRFEVFTGAGRRRRWSAADKARIVAESLSDADSVSAVARRHGLASTQLFAWRKAAREGSAAEPAFVPVIVGGASMAGTPLLADEPRRRGGGAIEVVIGDVRVFVERGADAASLEDGGSTASGAATVHATSTRMLTRRCEAVELREDNVVISNAEMDRRWQATRAVMARDGIDWLIATTGHPFGYYRWLTNRVGLAGPLAAIGMEGEVILASHGDEVHHRPHDSYGVKHVASCSQLNMMVNTHAPLLIKEMRAKPVKRIGLLGTGFISVSTRDAIRDAFPDAEIVDATDAIARIKAIKSPEEMTLIREAAAAHDEAVELAKRTLRPGITARDVVEEVRSHFTRKGSGMQTLMGGSAPRGQICRYSGPIERKIESGDLFSMLIECAMESGYYSETMPTMCLGEVPKDLQLAFDHACEIQEQLAQAVRPGMLPSELLAMNDVFMQAHGYPGEHRLLGHSQGIDLVERPAFSPLGENLTIEHDMVISIHPTVHTPTAWGLPSNLSFHFTEKGIERLLKTPQEIAVVA